MKRQVIALSILASFALFSLAGARIAMAKQGDEIPSNTGTPQTGAFTPGGRTPQGLVSQNTGAEGWYYDEKTYTWKQKK